MLSKSKFIISFIFCYNNVYHIFFFDYAKNSESSPPIGHAVLLVFPVFLIVTCGQTEALYALLNISSLIQK